jgi:hypothetical protein
MELLVDQAGSSGLSDLFRFEQQPEKCLCDVEGVVKLQATVMGAPQLIDPDQFALGFDDLDLGRIMNADLGRSADGHLLGTADAGTRAAHVPEMAGITAIRKKDVNFDENLEKGR